MQADIDMLQRRRSDLEDEELEVMEQREALDRELEALDAGIAALQARMTELQATIATATLKYAFLLRRKKTSRCTTRQRRFH